MSRKSRNPNINLSKGKMEIKSREPLARTIDRNYKLPEQATSQNFKYGLPTEKNKYDVKETIYSGENMPE